MIKILPRVGGPKCLLVVYYPSLVQMCQLSNNPRGLLFHQSNILLVAFASQFSFSTYFWIRFLRKITTHFENEKVRHENEKVRHQVQLSKESGRCIKKLHLKYGNQIWVLALGSNRHKQQILELPIDTSEGVLRREQATTGCRSRFIHSPLWADR